MRLEIIGWNEEKGRWSGVTFFIDNVCIMCLMWECVCICVSKNLLFYPCVPKTMIKWEKWSRGLLNGIFFIANKIVCVFLSCMVCGVLGVGSSGRWIYRIKFVSIFFFFCISLSLCIVIYTKWEEGGKRWKSGMKVRGFFYILRGVLNCIILSTQDRREELYI